LLNFIDGEYKDPTRFEWINVVDPSCGEVSCRVGRGSDTDVNEAVAAANAAFKTWSKTPPATRAALLFKIAQGIRDRLEELARLESCDVGKPLRLARMIDIPRAAENFEFFARLILVDETASHAMPDAVNFTQRCPVGVAALITPWNLPLYLLSWKVAPALACGNTVVIKPSEMTPLTACALSEIVTAAGLPKGVFNLVHGFGHEAGAPMVCHPDVRLVSFTGGTATGRIVASSAAASFKKTSLELGGKNPAVVFSDCDMDKAVEGVARGVFLNSGQVCLCCPRILIQRSIYEEFRDRLVAAARKIKVMILPKRLIPPYVHVYTKRRNLSPLH
jgi:aminomuconate-semialdehyde/2-hydroxymuconate-6-semialdehyde dehydrogenase